jgi:hypothetical protein
VISALRGGRSSRSCSGSATTGRSDQRFSMTVPPAFGSGVTC